MHRPSWPRALTVSDAASVWSGRDSSPIPVQWSRGGGRCITEASRWRILRPPVSPRCVRSMLALPPTSVERGRQTRVVTTPQNRGIDLSLRTLWSRLQDRSGSWGD
jgi:hypothetical protein